DERAIGQQEVVRCEHVLSHSASPYLARTNTKSTAKTRLMKYIASTRPTVRKNSVVRRPCASGWRATPAISWLPASPAPTAAPIAPPPSASPPPMKPPASSIDLVVTSTAISLLELSTCGR